MAMKKSNLTFTPPIFGKTILIISLLVVIPQLSKAQLTIESDGDAVFSKKAYISQDAYLKNIIAQTDYFQIKTSSGTYPAFNLKKLTSYIGICKGPYDPSYVLDVGGTMRVVSTLYYSDESFKTNIKDIPSERVSDLLTLKAKTFKYDYTKINDKSREKDKIKNKDHFGIIAQDLIKVYPELVYEDSLGVLSVDYIGLIPILLESVKSLHAEVEALKKEKSSSTMNKALDLEETEASSISYLGKNIPNPFNEQTTIEYYLPPNTGKASLYIYNLQGKQLKAIPLHQYENGEVIIHGSELQPGMYHYSLVADGKLVGTEQLVLTK